MKTLRKFLGVCPSVLVILLLAVASAYAGANQSTYCGVERQPVKTLHDKDAHLVEPQPSKAVIEDLVKLKAPSRKELASAMDMRFPEEVHTYQLEAALVGYKVESGAHGDNDFHIVIASRLNHSITMIVEIPHPDCMGESNVQDMRAQLEAKYGKATAKFRKLSEPPPDITVTGVLFFDFIHGQTGVAPNGVELHPVKELYFK